jgi:outer membrane murein-binding lipoprotein Lpp
MHACIVAVCVQEIEQIEEQWRAEVRLLEAEVAKLQEDGRRLRLSLHQQEEAEDSAAEAASE